VGDSFSLQLLMSSTQPVSSVPLAVGFDPGSLQVTSVSEGDFLKQDGAQTSFTSRVDPNGQIIITGSRAGDTGASALGSVATLSFRVIGSTGAETLIQLLSISPVGTGGATVTAPLPPPQAISVTP
jgi:general secretion pathway protein D